MTKKISVVMGTYNLIDKLKLVLASFEKQTFNHSEFEVIVVDSESDDGTAQWMADSNYSYSLRYIRQKNEGKASARNRGVQETQSNLVLITDADMIADKDMLAEHYLLQEENNFSVLIEGKTMVLTAEKEPVTDYIRRPYITHKVKHAQKLGFYYCLTGNLSFPKKFFEEFGGFDESFQNYGWEDVAFGYKLLKKNKKILLYCDKAINYHFHVWTDVQEVFRRESMGKSVHIMLEKFPELKTFLGINIANRIIYIVLSRMPKTVKSWLGVLAEGMCLSKWKKILLREYFFQKGFLSEKKAS